MKQLNKTPKWAEKHEHCLTQHYRLRTCYANIPVFGRTRLSECQCGPIPNISLLTAQVRSWGYNAIRYIVHCIFTMMRFEIWHVSVVKLGFVLKNVSAYWSGGGIATKRKQSPKAKRVFIIQILKNVKKRKKLSVPTLYILDILFKNTMQKSHLMDLTGSHDPSMNKPEFE